MRRTITASILSGILAAVLALSTAPAVARDGQKKQPPVQDSNQKPPVPAVLLPDLKINKIYFGIYIDPNPSQAFTMIRGDLKLGQTVFLVCELTNAGRDSKGPWRLGLYIDDVLVGNNAMGDLAGGKNLLGFGVWTPKHAGIHKFRCVLDDLKQILESSENNNLLEVMFKVVL
jgi:hypothetical protein